MEYKNRMPENISGYRSLPPVQKDDRRLALTDAIRGPLRSFTATDNDMITLRIPGYSREGQGQRVAPEIVKGYRESLRQIEPDPEERKALREDIAQTLEDWTVSEIPEDVRKAAAADLRAPSPTPS
jgi:hypothetical protein